MVANRFDNKAWSAKFMTFSFCLPLSLSALAMIFSTDPNSFSKVTAVLGPIPGTPGILSTLSPCNPNTSMTCSTRSISQLARISFSPKTSTSLPCLPGLYI